MINALLVLSLLAAFFAIEARKLIFSVAAFAVMGFSLCLVFFLLGSHEPAVIQLILEVIVLFVLWRAIVPAEEYSGWPLLPLVAALIFAVVLGLTAISVLPAAIDFKATTAGAVIGAAGSALAIIAVLFTAAVGALAVLRSPGRRS